MEKRSFLDEMSNWFIERNIPFTKKILVAGIVLIFVAIILVGIYYNTLSSGRIGEGEYVFRAENIFEVFAFITPAKESCIDCHELHLRGGISPIILAFPKDAHSDSKCTLCHVKPHMKDEPVATKKCTLCHGQYDAGLHSLHSQCIACHRPHTEQPSMRLTCLTCHTDKLYHNRMYVCNTCHIFFEE